MTARPANSEAMQSTRRSFLLGALAATAAVATKPARAWAASAAELAGVKALTFDMQGTVFDFYDPLLKVAHGIGRKHGLPGDWAATLPGDWSGDAHDIIVEISADGLGCPIPRSTARR